MKTLSFYYHPDCDTCAELKPAFKEIARLKKWKYKEINVENCETKICKTMEYVPTIYVNAKKLNLKDMKTLLTD